MGNPLTTMSRGELARILAIFIILFSLFSLFFATFFHSWGEQKYTYIGSMLSGVFGSSASLAGSIVAIVIALTALKIAQRELLTTHESVIEDFIKKQINPGLAKISSFVYLTQKLKLLRKETCSSDTYKKILQELQKKIYCINLYPNIPKLFFKMIEFIEKNEDKFRRELVDYIKSLGQFKAEKVLNISRSSPEFWEKFSSLVIYSIDLYLDGNYNFTDFFKSPIPDDLITFARLIHIITKDAKFKDSETEAEKDLFIETLISIIEETFKNNEFIKDKDLLRQKLNSLVLRPTIVILQESSSSKYYYI